MPRASRQPCPCGCGQASSRTRRERTLLCACGHRIACSRAVMLTVEVSCSECGEPFRPRCLDDLALLGDEGAIAELVLKTHRSQAASIAGQAAGRRSRRQAELRREREELARKREAWTDAERRAWLVEAYRTGELGRVARTAGERRALEIEARELLPF